MESDTDINFYPEISLLIQFTPVLTGVGYTDNRDILLL